MKALISTIVTLVIFSVYQLSHWSIVSNNIEPTTQDSAMDDGDDVELLGNVTEACIPIRDVQWEWNYYSRPNFEKNETTYKSSVKKEKNVLIAAFAGFDKYANMLEMTAPINKAYARKWKQDMVVLQGTSYVLPVDNGCTPQGRRTTLNKITLLMKGLKQNKKYDQVLILDTDAMMYDFNRDVSTLLPDKYMVAAHRVKQFETSIHTADINAGVMLWNLKHRATEKVANGWHNRSIQSIERLHFQGDQLPLQKALRKDDGVSEVYSLTEEFAYGHGTVIKHFIRRRGHRNWTDPTILNERELMIEQAAREICSSEEGLCDGISHVPYASI